MARPQIQIDKNQFENLCKLQCTLSEIAGWFNCSEDTIERWCKREYKQIISLLAASFALYASAENLTIADMNRRATKQERLAIFDRIDQLSEPVKKYLPKAHRTRFDLLEIDLFILLAEFAGWQIPFLIHQLNELKKECQKIKQADLEETDEKAIQNSCLTNAAAAAAAIRLSYGRDLAAGKSTRDILAELKDWTEKRLNRDTRRIQYTEDTITWDDIMLGGADDDDEYIYHIMDDNQNRNLSPKGLSV